jgi:hypothetical protein
MSPIALMLILLGVLVVILVVDRIYRRRRAKVIAVIGAEFNMNYSPLDRFALTERLMTLPQWTMRASDLSVKDVLYTTRNGVRCFVATVKCRWSMDQDASRFIVRVFERADHQNHFEIESEASDHPREDSQRYRKLIAQWLGGRSAAPTSSR